MFFRVFLPLLVLSIQFLLYLRTARWLKSTYPTARWALTSARILFIVFNAAAVYVIIVRPSVLALPDWLIYAGAYPYIIWHGSTFFIGLVILVTWLLKMPFKSMFWLSTRFTGPKRKISQLRATPAYQGFDASRRVFLRRGMYGLTAVSFGGSIYGVFAEKSSYEITEAEFALPNLDPGLSGFTIALVSDIHSSLFMTKKEMDEYVRVINSLRADLIVVDGDFVNSAVEEVYPFVESFSNLRAPFGAFGVMGNHDYYNRDPELVAKEVNDCGIKLLRNDKIVIERNGGQFYLLGVDDVGRATTAQIKLEAAIGYAPLAIPKILLCHRPYYLRQAADRNIDLVLSGHTHGGQVVLGHVGDLAIAPASLVSQYVWGKYRFDNTHMYVSRGIGTVGLPIRINCPPEITKITLVPSTS